MQEHGDALDARRHGRCSCASSLGAQVARRRLVEHEADGIRAAPRPRPRSRSRVRRPQILIHSAAHRASGAGLAPGRQQFAHRLRRDRAGCISAGADQRQPVAEPRDARRVLGRAARRFPRRRATAAAAGRAAPRSAAKSICSVSRSRQLRPISTCSSRPSRSRGELAATSRSSASKASSSTNRPCSAAQSSIADEPLARHHAHDQQHAATRRRPAPRAPGTDRPGNPCASPARRTARACRRRGAGARGRRRSAWARSGSSRPPHRPRRRPRAGAPDPACAPRDRRATASAASAPRSGRSRAARAAARGGGGAPRTAARNAASRHALARCRDALRLRVAMSESRPMAVTATASARSVDAAPKAASRSSSRAPSPRSMRVAGARGCAAAASATAPVTSSASAAFSTSASRCGPRSCPSNTARRPAALCAASPPARSAGVQRAQAVARADRALVRSTRPGCTSYSSNGPHRRRFVPARLAVHDEHALDRHAGQRLRHQLRGVAAVGADQAERRLGRIGQRTEQVEHGAHAERAAHRRDFLHRRVVVRREQEREARRGEAVARALLVERQRQAERLEQVGAAGAARDRAVAVLDDAHAHRGDQQRGAGREVEAARRVAAGADDVDGRRPGRQVGRRASERIAAAKPRTSSAVTPLTRSAASSAPGHRRRHRRIGQRDQQLARLGFGQVAPLQQSLERCRAVRSWRVLRLRAGRR